MSDTDYDACPHGIPWSRFCGECMVSPSVENDGDARERMARAWEEGYRQGETTFANGGPKPANPYRVIPPRTCPADPHADA